MNYLVTSGHMLYTKFLWGISLKLNPRLIATFFKAEKIIFLSKSINFSTLDAKWLPKRIKA